MGASQDVIARAESILRRAQQAAGMAAYQYFFIAGTTAARAAYEIAMATEAEASALLDDLRGSDA